MIIFRVRLIFCVVSPRRNARKILIKSDRDSKNLRNILITSHSPGSDLDQETIEYFWVEENLLQLFPAKDSDAKHEGKDFNKLIVFDEAPKYIDSPDLVSGLVDMG